MALIASACGGDAETNPSTTAFDETTTTTAAAESTTTTVLSDPASLDTFLSAARASTEESYRFQANITMSGSAMAAEGFPDGIDMQVSASIDPATNSSIVVMDLGDIFGQLGSDQLEGLSDEDIAALSEPIEVITIGTSSWTRMGFFSAMFGMDPNAYLEGEGDVLGVNELGASFTSPDDFTSMFEESGAEVEDLGTETIRGVETTHLRAVIDGAKMAEQMEPAERAEFEQVYPSDIEFPIEIWVGKDDGRLYRYLLDMDELLLAQTQDADLSGIDRMTMMVEVWDYGSDLGIAPPSADLIVTEEELAAGFAGGLPDAN
ncbi:MAG: hypothetical protein KJN81_02395 [Acidimicrobiia bacterium]|nr:hypothetical protein [Acidimicrobiia bacterium]NNL27258.1 hypothetical protein [Acidimicrobiia bacterium]